MEEQLYSEPGMPVRATMAAPLPQIEVTGLSTEKASRLATTAMSAYQDVTVSMTRYGLKPSFYSVERVEAEPLGFGSGLVGGYTNMNGDSAHLNTSIMPYTEDHHLLRYRISDIGGPFGRHLRGKFGGSANAEYHLGRTTAHEAVHMFTQLRPMKKAEGGKTERLAESLHGALVKRYAAKLPEGLEFLAPMFARAYFVPMLEGLTEVMTDKAYSGMTVQDARSNSATDPTTYGTFAWASASAMDKAGYSDPFKMVADWAYGDGDRVLDNYAAGFESSLQNAYGRSGGCRECAFVSSF